MKKHRIRRRKILRIHQWLGVTSALFVLILSITGIAVNHAHTQGLDKGYIPAPLLSLYGLKSPEVTGFNVNGVWLASTGQQLYAQGNGIDFVNVGGCERLIGAVPYVAMESLGPESTMVAVCARQLILMTSKAEVIEVTPEVPATIDVLIELGSSGSEDLCCAVNARGEGGEYYRFDHDAFEWHDNIVNNQEDVQVLKASPVPEVFLDHLRENNALAGISWERFLLDLHSGRLFDLPGVLVMDLAAVFMIILALTGIWALVTRPARSKPSK